RAYLESIALVADADAVDSSTGTVTLMTLHASKGLEFPAVAMIGLEEGSLPHSRANESQSELEEERRLAFVGITRAMKHLQISHTNRRTIRGMSERMIPSRFLEEIGKEHIITSDQSDTY
ncbi:MAG TPA: DNA helicase UvrD, partial [Phycisphaerales bacterium]|nr:DNA helicase UvrD [Phycisphaerales bacterium]